MPPPPQRERYHSAPMASRGAKKDDAHHSVKKASRHDASVSASATKAAAAVAAVSTREEVLREALAKALANPTAGTTTSSALDDVDSYGKGSPTDRLQFGYSPATAAEAVAFHSRFTTAAWLAARKKNGNLVFTKKQKLSPPNCEPMTTILKLQRHWKKINAFQSDVRGTGSKLKAADLDNLLDMLASKQRIGEDE